MITPQTLVSGKYYIATYAGGSEYYVQAIEHNWVRTLFHNGSPYDYRGSLTGAKLIEEISEGEALSGVRFKKEGLFINNKNAKCLLKKD